MKSKKLLLLFILASTTAFGQTFSDDFESYSPGDYLGSSSSTWTTWSGTIGGTEDVQINNNNALSGTNSIYFSSSAANGGPQDVVLPFQAHHTTGIFEFEAAFNVETNKNAYFNFQGNQTIGNLFALNCNIDGGTISVDDGVTNNLLLVTNAYTDNTWFTLKIEANLVTGIWEMFIDGNSIGTWANSVSEVAALDIYPVQNSGFYIDDISYTHGPYTLLNLNASPTAISANLILAGTSDVPTVNISNLGQTPITSFDVSLTYDGNTFTENVTGVNIASLGVETVTFASSITAIAGSNNMVVTVSNVNGTTDDDVSDDTKTQNIDPIVPAVGKMVVAEEATGTWCGWCPRGAVSMAEMTSKYPGFFQGIAVHNGDPMVNSIYDAGIGNNIAGYPSGLVDRGSDIDPTAFEVDFLQRITVAPAATLEHGALYDANARLLEVSLTTTGVQAVNGNYKIACVILEDDVTGSGNGWSQTNYYSFQSQNIPLVGDGLDWQAQSNPVPAATMVYDHVAREISPSYEGHSNSFPSGIAVGQNNVFNFEFNLDPSWDDSKIHIVTLLIDPSGRIDNAGSTTIADAVANGFDGMGTFITDVSTLEGPDASLSIYPNPTSGNAQAEITLDAPATIDVNILDVSGKIVYTTNLAGINGRQVIEIPSARFASGLYTVNILTGTQLISKKLMVR